MTCIVQIVIACSYGVMHAMNVSGMYIPLHRYIQTSAYLNTTSSETSADILRRPFTHVPKLPHFPNGYLPKTGLKNHFEKLHNCALQGTPQKPVNCPKWLCVGGTTCDSQKSCIPFKFGHRSVHPKKNPILPNHPLLHFKPHRKMQPKK